MQGNTKRLAIALLALCAGNTSAALASAQVPTQGSPPGAIFVPDDFVPLSDFSTDVSAGQVTLTVAQDVLQWLVTHSAPVQVARKYHGSVTYHTPDLPIVPSSGSITLTTSSPGSYTVVSDAFLNDYLVGPSAILTHWESYTPPDNRGKQEPGANDYIQLLSHVTVEPDGSETLVLVGGATEINCPAGIAVPDSTKKFLTDDHAVFSDGSGVPYDASVPAYERYIAENWSTGVSEFICVWRSDKIRARHGWPLAYRNGSSAFSLPGVQGVMNDVPVIQVVNGLIVSPPGDDPLDGKEESLISIVLPAYWVPAVSLLPTPPHPILFYSYYDLNGTVFGHASDPVFDAVGSLGRTYEQHEFVAVIWNGGGAGVSQSKQRSAHDNAAELLDMTKNLAGGDPDRVVMSGGSRGGTAALSISSNPYDLPYRVRYVIAETPVVNIGSLAPLYGDSTFQLIQSTMQDLTGYCNGWVPGWENPDTPQLDFAVDTCMEVLLGTSDQGVIDAQLANDSDLFVSKLKTQVDGVVLRAGTHDFSKPFPLIASYYEKLIAQGIPTRFEVSYRFGHTYTDGTMPDEALFMDQLISPDPGFSFQSGVLHYERLGEGPSEYGTGVRFFPQHQPVVFEAPLVVGHGQLATWTVTGPPGAAYWIELLEVDMSQLPTIVPIGSPWVQFSSTLPSTGNVFATESFKQALDNSSTGVRCLVHTLYYVSPGGSSVTVDSSSSSALPLFTYSPTYVLPASASPVFGDKVESRTSGLSSEAFTDVP